MEITDLKQENYTTIEECSSSDGETCGTCYFYYEDDSDTGELSNQDNTASIEVSKDDVKIEPTRQKIKLRQDHGADSEKDTKALKRQVFETKEYTNRREADIDDNQIENDEQSIAEQAEFSKLFKKLPTSGLFSKLINEIPYLVHTNEEDVIQLFRDTLKREPALQALMNKNHVLAKDYERLFEQYMGEFKLRKLSMGVFVGSLQNEFDKANYKFKYLQRQVLKKFQNKGLRVPKNLKNFRLDYDWKLDEDLTLSDSVYRELNVCYGNNEHNYDDYDDAEESDIENEDEEYDTESESGNEDEIDKAYESEHNIDEIFNNSKSNYTSAYIEDRNESLDSSESESAHSNDEVDIYNTNGYNAEVVETSDESENMEDLVEYDDDYEFYSGDSEEYVSDAEEDSGEEYENLYNDRDSDGDEMFDIESNGKYEGSQSDGGSLSESESNSSDFEASLDSSEESGSDPELTSEVRVNAANIRQEIGNMMQRAYLEREADQAVYADVDFESIRTFYGKNLPHEGDLMANLNININLIRDEYNDEEKQAKLAEIKKSIAEEVQYSTFSKDLEDAQDDDELNGEPKSKKALTEEEFRRLIHFCTIGGFEMANSNETMKENGNKEVAPAVNANGSSSISKSTRQGGTELQTSCKDDVRGSELKRDECIGRCKNLKENGNGNGFGDARNSGADANQSEFGERTNTVHADTSIKQEHAAGAYDFYNFDDENDDNDDSGGNDIEEDEDDVDVDNNYEVDDEYYRNDTDEDDIEIDIEDNEDENENGGGYEHNEKAVSNNHDKNFEVGLANHDTQEEQNKSKSSSVEQIEQEQYDVEKNGEIEKSSKLESSDVGQNTESEGNGGNPSNFMEKQFGTESTSGAGTTTLLSITPESSESPASHPTISNLITTLEVATIGSQKQTLETPTKLKLEEDQQDLLPTPPSSGHQDVATNSEPQLEEIEMIHIIPKNLKAKSRKDPTKYSSQQILKKDPIFLKKCPICGRKFYRSEHLKRHLTSVHNNDKPFLCEICGKHFTRKDNLTQHQRRKHSSHRETVEEQS